MKTESSHDIHEIQSQTEKLGNKMLSNQDKVEDLWAFSDDCTHSN